MNRSLNLACIAAALALSLGVSTSQASQVTLPLGTGSTLYSGGNVLTSGNQIENYFNGGDDSGGQGPGPTLGFTFSGNADALKAGPSYGKFLNNPSKASEVVSFVSSSSTAAYVNYSPGFSQLSFNYSYSGNNPGATDVTAYFFSQANGGGTLLGSDALAPGGTTAPCSGGNAYCTWESVSLAAGGAAESVLFATSPTATTTASPATLIEFDGITVTPVPLPASLWLMIGGIGGLIGYGRRRTA
jgi:hypothetical protein